VLVGATLAATIALQSSSSAATTPAPQARPPVSEPWWVPMGLRGQEVTAVSATGSRIDVVAGGSLLRSGDGGATFAPGAGAAPPPPAQSATSVSGVVVAVHGDGTVWRRTPSAAWARALLLLPQSLIAGAPRVTAVAAWSVPVSTAVYVGVDGYGVLESIDGGDDWIRADPGLPGRVLTLATDPSARALYAGTADGLWVHHLRAVPAPPVYPPTDLRWRWLGTALVTLAGCAVALGLLRRLIA